MVRTVQEVVHQGVGILVVLHLVPPHVVVDVQELVEVVVPRIVGQLVKVDVQELVPEIVVQTVLELVRRTVPLLVEIGLVI